MLSLLFEVFQTKDTSKNSSVDIVVILEHCLWGFIIYYLQSTSALLYVCYKHQVLTTFAFRCIHEEPT